MSLGGLTPFHDRPVEGPLAALRMRQEMPAGMGDLTGKRILDVGCGTGTMALMIRRANPQAGGIGLDGDPQILEIARSKARAQGLEVRFGHALSFALPFPDGSFDFVIVSMRLRHLSREDKQRSAAESFRVLGADFAEARIPVGRALKPFARHFERVAAKLDGFLPVMFSGAGFRNDVEIRRYLLGSPSLFRASRA